MSEPTTEAEHSKEAEEPSMEDILASIRRIIADDDQKMDLAPTQALDLNSDDLTSQTSVSEDAVIETDDTDVDSLLQGLNSLTAEQDENSVFKTMSLEDETTSAEGSMSDDEGELIDLDIEALLGMADTNVEADELDLSAVATAKADELTDESILDMPELRPEPMQSDSLNVNADSDGVEQALDEFIDPSDHKDNSQNNVKSEDVEADTLFDELEGLLAEASPEAVPKDDTAVDSLFNEMVEPKDTTADVLVDPLSDEDIIEPIVKLDAKKRGFTSGFAAAGFSAIKPKLSLNKPARTDIEEATQTNEEMGKIDGQLASGETLTDTDVQLDEMLNGLVEDLEEIENTSVLGDVDETASTDETASESLNGADSSIEDEPLAAGEADFVQTSLSTNEGDMDLVKSLMAGLTDPEAETFEAADTVADEELANPENEALEAVSESETVASDDTDNIMDDILDMSMDDELSTHSDDVEGDLEALLEIPSPDNTSSISVTAEQVAQDEALNITENVEAQEVEAQEVEAQESNVEAQEAEVQQTNVQENELEAEVEIEAQEVETQDHDASEGLSLYDIAAEAERDAVVMEQQGEIQSSVDAVIELDAVPTDVEEDLESAPKPIFDLNRGLAALGLTSLGASLGVGAVMASGKSEAEETELNEEQDFDVQERDEGGETQTETENLEKESADMASATAQKDVILDDVTEAASAGAFASLSKMVEEEAITAERGDRIGDLVMEALRPMLKEWLDANLKGIVERAVQKEVKRIASGK